MMNIMPGGRILSRAGRGAFPSGTTMLFIQAAAPLGWVRVTTFDDALLRINGTTTPGSGGSNGFVATFNAQTQTGSQSITTATTAANSTGTGTSGGHSLSIAELAAHTHTVAGADTGCGGRFGGSGTCPTPKFCTENTGSTGSGTAHTHSVPALSIPSLAVNSFTVGPLSFSTSIKYVDALIARKT